MGKVKEVFLAGAVLLGLGAISNDVANFYREYKNQKPDPVPHSSFLDPQMPDSKAYFADMYLTRRIWGKKTYESALAERKREHALKMVRTERENLTEYDIPYILNNPDDRLAKQGAEILIQAGDRRMIPYIARDLSRRGEKYGFERGVEILKKSRYPRLEEILLYLLYDHYKKEPRVFSWYISGMMEGYRCKEPAAEHLTKIGSQRAFQKFTEKEDWVTVAVFINNNSTRGFVHNYREPLIPVMIRELENNRDCFKGLQFGAALYNLDSVQARMYASYNFCKEIKNLLVGKPAW